MSHSQFQAHLAFVLALHSSVVAANVLYPRESVIVLARDDSPDGGDSNGDDGPSTTTSTTTSSSDSKHHSSTTYSSNIQSSSSITATTTGTLTGSSSVSSSSTSISSASSSSAQNNQNNSTSTANQGLSTAARTGLSFGIMFFLIFSATLFCYLKRRSRKARENASYEATLLSSEVRQYRPPDLVASRERELPPPPRLDTAHPNLSDISHSPPPSAISSVAPLLTDGGSRPNSHSVSAWNRNSILLQEIGIPQIASQRMSTFPNPHDPFSAPARSTSYASSSVSMASSPPHSTPYDASTASMTSTFVAPGANNSDNSQPQRRLSALHTNLARHQKELELEHRKQSLDTQAEPQDPPPEYSS